MTDPATSATPTSLAAGSPELAVERVAVGPAEGRARNRATFGLCVGAAMALHAGVLAAAILIGARHDEVAGGGGIALDAISVEVSVVPATALDARASEAATAAGQTSAEAVDGRMEAAAAARQPPSSSAREAASHPPAAALTTPDRAPEAPDQLALAAAERVAPPLADASAANTPDAATPAAAEGAAATPPAQPVSSDQGGASSLSAAASTDSAAAVAARAGAVKAYARQVVAALAQTKPRAAQLRGERGTVHLSFAIAPDGALESLSVVRSSGRERVDAVAMDAIRRAHFPSPPAGASLLERTYDIPYTFR